LLPQSKEALSWSDNKATPISQIMSEVDPSICCLLERVLQREDGSCDTRIQYVDAHGGGLQSAVVVEIFVFEGVLHAACDKSRKAVMGDVFEGDVEVCAEE
jgi:hypothetical protein